MILRKHLSKIGPINSNAKTLINKNKHLIYRYRIDTILKDRMCKGTFLCKSLKEPCNFPKSCSIGRKQLGDPRKHSNASKNCNQVLKLHVLFSFLQWLEWLFTWWFSLGQTWRLPVVAMPCVCTPNRRIPFKGERKSITYPCTVFWRWPFKGLG